MYREYDLGVVGTLDFYRKTVEMHKDTLISLRKTTPKPEELEWEIRVYDYILVDPAVRYPQYQLARFDDNNMPRSKRTVIKELGWDIP